MFDVSKKCIMLNSSNLFSGTYGGNINRIKCKMYQEIVVFVKKEIYRNSSLQSCNVSFLYSFLLELLHSNPINNVLTVFLKCHNKMYNFIISLPFSGRRAGQQADPPHLVSHGNASGNRGRRRCAWQPDNRRRVTHRRNARSN